MIRIAETVLIVGILASLSWYLTALLIQVMR